MITLLNKIDLINNPDQISLFQKEFERGIPVSAKTGEGVDLLLQLLSHQLSEQLVLLKLLIPSSQMRLVWKIYEEGEVFNREDRPEGVWLEARVPIRLSNQIKMFASQ
jgi:GTP-binding protein HflX